MFESCWRDHLILFMLNSMLFCGRYQSLEIMVHGVELFLPPGGAKCARIGRFSLPFVFQLDLELADSSHENCRAHVVEPAFESSQFQSDRVAGLNPRVFANCN